MPDNVVQSGTRKSLEAFDAVIKQQLLQSPPEYKEFPKIPDDLFNEDHNEVLEPAEPDMCAYQADDYTPEESDEYLGAFIMMLQQGESI